MCINLSEKGRPISPHAIRGCQRTFHSSNTFIMSASSQSWPVTPHKVAGILKTLAALGQAREAGPGRYAA